jgi:hypothetical protein
MTPSQLQQIAEEQYPHYDKQSIKIEGVNDGMISDYNRITNIERAAFIHGLTFDGWIKVTPETMPSKDEPPIDILAMRENGEYEIVYSHSHGHLKKYFTHYQFITPPKTDKP